MRLNDEMINLLKDYVGSRSIGKPFFYTLPSDLGTKKTLPDEIL